MAIEITTPRDIFNTLPGTNNNMSREAIKVNDDLQHIVEKTKYHQRSELDETGYAQIFDNAQDTLLRVNANKTTCFLTGENLRYQQQAWKDINSIMTKFESTRVKNTAAAGTITDQVNKALTEIEEVIKRKNSQGEYIFGGNNPKVNPLSIFNGKERVPTSLVTNSNVIKDVFVNNYSDAYVDETIVTASSIHEVKQSFLYAGMDPLIKTIGYLNMHKEGTAPLEAIASSQFEQKEKRGEIEIAIGLELEKVVKALDVNKNDEKEVRNTLKQFDGDVVELASRASNTMISFGANLSIKRAVDKMDDQLLEMLKNI